MPASALPLSRRDLRTLMLAALGGALEYYDFIIFVFFATLIGQLFFPPDTPEWLRQLQTFGLFAAGYLARPLGGIIMAHFGDRSGRKRMFLLSVLLMAIPTLAIGLLPTYAAIGHAAPLALLLMRVLQGAAVGGEVPGAWTFVAEHVPERHVGVACGVLTAGLTAGIVLGSLVASALTAGLGPEQMLAWGWRVPFLIGGVFGLLAVQLRRLLAETPVFEELRRRRALVAGLPLKVVLAGRARAVVQSMLLTWLLTGAIVVVILMTPTLVQSLFAVPAAAALSANTLATLALTVGCVVFGWLADRLGAARVLGLGSLGLLVATYLLYAGVRAAPAHLDLLYATAGLASGLVAVVPVFMVRAFPPAVRFSGVSFAYNVAYAVFGGLTPLLVTLLIQRDALAPAHYVAALCVMGMAVSLIARSRVAASDSIAGGVAA
ncbi:MFS transporter [Dokdonella sp.]|uniref:MFS transporter n=1 Tax=Dokdonella sp. TaxID=2291710 RepID=UPI0031BF5401|nr:MFS transporter [Dokdonella sp.]